MGNYVSDYYIKLVCKPANKNLIGLAEEFNPRYVGWISCHLTSAVYTINKYTSDLVSGETEHFRSKISVFTFRLLFEPCLWYHVSLTDCASSGDDQATWRCLQLVRWAPSVQMVDRCGNFKAKITSALFSPSMYLTSFFSSSSWAFPGMFNSGVYKIFQPIWF